CRASRSRSGSTTLYRSFVLSIRRRHTRSTRDWSSYVCCSDLALEIEREGADEFQRRLRVEQHHVQSRTRYGISGSRCPRQIGDDSESVPPRYPAPAHLQI